MDQREGPHEAGQRHDHEIPGRVKAQHIMEIVVQPPPSGGPSKAQAGFDASGCARPPEIEPRPHEKYDEQGHDAHYRPAGFAGKQGAVERKHQAEECLRVLPRAENLAGIGIDKDLKIGLRRNHIGAISVVWDLDRQKGARSVRFCHYVDDRLERDSVFPWHDLPQMGMERLIGLLFEDEYCSRQANDDDHQGGGQPQIEMDLYEELAKCHRGILLFSFENP